MDTLRRRASLFTEIRFFFAARGVLEVDTPVLARSAPSEPNLTSFALSEATPRYLQTSPEFAMKRLLAAGSGPIYQLARCFRQGEAGPRHNTEFTLLEWYRPGFDHHQLMDEVATLLADLLPSVVGPGHAEKLSYRELFMEHLQLNPHTAATSQLAALARERMDLQADDMARRDWLDLLMSHVIEPQLARLGTCFIYDYPAEQAELARLGRNAHGETVARRFECYVDGMELANGYHELLDADELRARFELDQLERERRGLAFIPFDERLLAALAEGVPPCAGVALGFDRLLMLSLGASHIDEVLPFSDSRV